MRIASTEEEMALAIDLFSGCGGWADGLLSEGWDVIGFDIERWPYPGQLVLQDVQTLRGSQFKNVDLIVASPPCQAYSYRAMPWKRAKALPPPDNTLFEACFRIQREASEAAGHHIPMIVENVRGAQKWVGRAKWHYGSYYLWGDVPALMPMTGSLKKGRSNFHFFEKTGLPSPSFHGALHEASVQRHEAIKNNGGSWFAVAHNTRQFSSHSNARKQASAMIAKIPFPLASYIARVFKSEDVRENLR